MAEKDITEKLLEDYPDVFADIVNVLIYNGRDTVKANDLERSGTLSQYKAANTIHGQELDDETVAKFKSDFRIVADYFVQMRKNREYIPSAQEIKYVDDVLNLLAAVSGDQRFQITQNEPEERRITKMEDWLTKALDKATENGMYDGFVKCMKDGLYKGIKDGFEKGLKACLEKFVKCVDSLMKNEGYTKEHACSVLDSTVDEYEKAKQLLAEAAVMV